MAAVAPNWELLLLESVLNHCSRGIVSLLCPWKMWNSTADPTTCQCWRSYKFLVRQELYVPVQTKWIFPVCWPTTSRVLSHQFREIPLLPFAVRVIIVPLNGHRECLHISFSPDTLAFPSFFLSPLYFYFFSHLFTNGTLNFRTRRVVAQRQWKMYWLWISEIWCKSHLCVILAEWI